MLLPAPSFRRRTLISLTPLIDIVFILLIFFMLASTFQEWRALEVETAPPGHTPRATRDPVVSIRIDAAGRYSLEGVPLDPDSFSNEIRALLTRSPGSSATVSVEAGVALDALIQLLDRLDAGGIAHTVVPSAR